MAKVIAGTFAYTYGSAEVGTSPGPLRSSRI